MEYSVQHRTAALSHSVLSPSESVSIASPGRDALFSQGLALAKQLDQDSLSDETGSTASADPVQFVPNPDLPFPSLSDISEDFTTVQSTAGSEPLPSAKVTATQTIPPDSQQPWAQVWLQRGFAKIKQQNFEGAIDNFQRVLQQEPQSVEALNGLGVAQYHLADNQGAARSFRTAIQAQPTQPRLYCNLGTALYALPDLVNAIAAFQKAARLDPKDVLAYYGLGLALMQQQQYQKAIAAFQRAVAINDHHAHSYYGLGYTHYRLGDLPAAIAAIGKAKQRDPSYGTRYEAFLQHCLRQDDSSNPA